MALWITAEFREKGIRLLADFRANLAITVFNTSAHGFLFNALGTGVNIIHSEYFDYMERGRYKDGVLNRALQALTFTDESIDLIISEDVFQHVPDYRNGFVEVYRVLKWRRMHIFSIPYYFGSKTYDLFRIENGKPVLFEPIEYHGEAIRRQISCFTHFGYDTLRHLEELGFDARVELSQLVEQARYGILDCYTFIAKKR